MPDEEALRPSDRTTSAGIRIGVLSDTHGRLNPSIESIFRDVRRIIHTGDIESPQILTDLARIAPVNAIRGNMDFGKWAAKLPREEMITVSTVTIYALHDLTTLSLDPAAAGIDVVLSGHTHRAEAYWQGPLLFLNPGSATLPRHGQLPSAAVLTIEGGKVAYQFYRLEGR
jgi:putative phosphoesterase